MCNDATAKGNRMNRSRSNRTAILAGNLPTAPAKLSAEGAPIYQPRATPWVPGAN